MAIPNSALLAMRQRMGIQPPQPLLLLNPPSLQNRTQVQTRTRIGTVPLESVVRPPSQTQAPEVERLQTMLAGSGATVVLDPPTAENPPAPVVHNRLQAQINQVQGISGGMSMPVMLALGAGAIYFLMKK